MNADLGHRVLERGLRLLPSAKTAAQLKWARAATRFGHGDDGQLLDRVYDRGDRVQRARRALDEIGSLRNALAQPAPRPGRLQVVG